MIRKFILILFALLLVGGLGGGYYIWYYFNHAGGTVKITISQAMITDALERAFPKKKTYLKLLHVTYDQPVVALRAGTDRMSVSLAVRVEAGLEGVLSKTYNGSATLDTAVGYDPQTYRFFLRDPQLEALEVPKLSAENLGILRESLNLASALWFEEIPVYRIKEYKLQESVARHVLREVEIKNDRVVATLGLQDGATATTNPPPP